MQTLVGSQVVRNNGDEHKVHDHLAQSHWATVGLPEVVIDNEDADGLEGTLASLVKALEQMRSHYIHETETDVENDIQFVRSTVQAESCSPCLGCSGHRVPSSPTFMFLFRPATMLT